MALVPYAPNGYLPIFHEAERQFTFANQSIWIKQNWADSGVAGVVWDAAIVLATYLQTLSNGDGSKSGLNNFEVGPFLRSKNVLELGAGTGLVGIVACLLGADVVITDTKDALNRTIENVEGNLGSSCKNLTVQERGSHKVEVLHWGQDLQKWKNTSWDIIVGADIVYIQETFKDLLETLKVLTESNKETLILLSCRIRYQRDLDFLDILKTDFTVDELLYDKERDVKVYKVKQI